MANNNGVKYFAQGGTFYVDGASTKNEQALALYDPLRQAAYLPSLRKGENGKASITMPFQDMGFEGLWSEIQMELTGTASREVGASEFYWAEYLSLESLAFAIDGDNASAANSKTTTISRFAQTRNGAFATPQNGWDAILTGVGSPSGILVTIENVVKNNNGSFSITIKAKNGVNIDLSKKSKYKLVMIPMKPQTKGTDAPISTTGLGYNLPMLQKSWVQKYESGLAVHQDTIDNWIYDRQWQIALGVDSDGKEVEYVYVPELSKQLTDRIAASRTLRILMDKRDNVKNEGFNGVVPTVEDFGQFNFAYDDLMIGSFKSILFSIVKSIQKVNGSPTNYIQHDFNFHIDYGEAMAAMVKQNSSPINLGYELFGSGGEGERDLTYYEFRNWRWNGYDFISKRVNTFDTQRFGQVLSHFALVLPAKRFQDNNGNTVPIITMCHNVGAEPAKTQYIRVDDARDRGLRTINVYAQDAFGIEFHGATKTGMIYKPNNGEL